MRDKIIQATERALRKRVPRRFLSTERGYQGIFYAALLGELVKGGIVNEDCVLEMEYQKKDLHNVGRQRPDIILHVPIEHSNAAVNENNFAVWAMKWRGTANDAQEDFHKLDQMFGDLRYPLGIFVNIDTQIHHGETYNGPFADRLHTVAVWFEGQMETRWGAARQ